MLGRGARPVPPMPGSPRNWPPRDDKGLRDGGPRVERAGAWVVDSEELLDASPQLHPLLTCSPGLGFGFR